MRRRRLEVLGSFPLSEFPRGLAFSRDARRLAVGAADGRVIVLSPRRAELLHEARLGDSVTTLAFTPAGDELAVASFDGAAHLFDGAGRALPPLPGGGRGWVEHLAWSPSGQLGTAAGRVARVWTATGEPVLQSEPHPATISALAFGPRTGTLYTACYGGVRAFPLRAGEEARLLDWKGSVLSMALSPDEAVVACGTQESTVHFWRLADGSNSEMSGYPRKPLALAWSADASLLATSGAEVITIWRFEGEGPEGTEPLVLAGHEGQASRLAFSPAGRLLASGGEDRAVLLWRPRSDPAPRWSAQLEAPVGELAFSPDGALVAAADVSGRLTVWAAPTTD
jgi:WD40 repeat protein